MHSIMIYTVLWILMNLPEITNNKFNELFNEFTHIVLQVIDKHAPVEKFSRKQKKLLKKPWITKTILVSIKKTCSV